MQVSVEQAKTHGWWSDFLEARMIAIQSMRVLGKSETEIHSVIGVDADQTALLISEANRRQAEVHPKEES
jgi:hypothetical protein